MKDSFANSNVAIPINATLANEYKNSYLKVFGTQSHKGKSLEDLIANFLEDRLAEEIEFLQDELNE